jgi:6-phosphofructokinase 1
LERLTGFETRVMILGHLQRGGTPTAFDRVLATRLGVRAVEAVFQGNFGTMVASQGTEIVLVPLTSSVSKPRSVPQSRLDETAWFGV